MGKATASNVLDIVDAVEADSYSLKSAILKFLVPILPVLEAYLLVDPSLEMSQMLHLRGPESEGIREMSDHFINDRYVQPVRYISI